MTRLKGFELVPKRIREDAAFLIGLLQPHSKIELYAVPVYVDGWLAMSLCIKARKQDDKMILHPVAIIPHKDMKITDARQNQPNTPVKRLKVDPVDKEQAKLMLEAIDDPNLFFSSIPD